MSSKFNMLGLKPWRRVTGGSRTCRLPPPITQQDVGSKNINVELGVAWRQPWTPGDRRPPSIRIPMSPERNHTGEKGHLSGIDDSWAPDSETRELNLSAPPGWEKFSLNVPAVPIQLVRLTESWRHFPYQTYQLGLLADGRMTISRTVSWLLKGHWGEMEEGGHLANKVATK